MKRRKQEKIMKTFLNSRAFTLAELMAVVVIIAILAGIAIGSYRRSVDRAKFADGRSLAHQVAAARDSYYYDRLYSGDTAVIPTNFSWLPLELDGASGSTYNGDNFSISIANTNYVRAYDNDGNYGICVYQEAGVRGKVKAETCVGLTTEGKEFCQSMGYSSPASSC